MFKTLRRLFSVMRCVRTDTHLWCISVLGGAVLLCVSFFVEPSQRQLVVGGANEKSVAQQKIIEYSSVLGSLSGIESLEDDEVEEIVEAIPDHSEVFTDDALSASECVDDYFRSHENAEDNAGPEADIDLVNVYSIEEIDALERLVQCEASIEDVQGKTLVANVVLNRVDTGIWGDDIMSVIESPGQFRPVMNGAYKVVEVDPVTKSAVMDALLGKDESQGAIYFQKSAATVWGDKEYLFRHGSHSFYK
ncbi:MAG: cell wall hydrolase [Lachnospiraceae bacterium]|nr:cell wall hydrolase [Lachnospiraceae bacterium]